MSLHFKLSRNQNIISAIFIFLFAASIYLPTLNIPFISDEVYFIQRNEVHNAGELFTLFEKKSYDGYYYRPLPDLISGFTTLFFKYNYRYYRLFNLLIHSSISVLVYLFIFSLLKIPDKNKIALFAALFFAGFPLNDYSVIWHTDLFDRIMMLFYIAGILSFIRNNFKVTISSIIFFILSLLSKEMAFSFPLIIALTYYFFSNSKFDLRKSLVSSIPYVTVVVIFILARIILFNNDVFTAKDAHSAAGILDVVKNYFLFSGLVIFPFFIREVQNFIFANRLFSALSAIIIFIIIFAAIFKYKRKDHVLFFFILLFLLLIAPASRLFMRWYLYLPSIGFTAALSYIIFTVFPKKNNLKMVVAVIILIIYSTALVQKESLWIKYSNESIGMLKSFIKNNKDVIAKNKEAVFLTVPAKIDDIPVFQLGFDYLFNFYFDKNSNIKVEYLSKSYLNNFNDTIITKTSSNKIFISQTDNNYFILFNNEKNIKFEPVNFNNGRLNSLSINISEVNDKILYTFSNGKFYKLEGLR